MKVIKNINQTQKTFEFNDFFGLTEKFSDVEIDEKSIRKSYHFNNIEYQLPTDKNYLEGYVVGGRYFLCCNDGYLYECLSDKVQSVMQVSAKPCAVAFSTHGEEKILFADNTDVATIIDGNSTVTVDFMPSQSLAVYGGRIFSVYQDSVSFTKLYDFGKDDLDLSQEGVLYLPKSEGGVIGTFNVDGALYLFTKENIFSLSGSGDSIDFKLEKIETERFSIHDKTLCKSDDGFIFICDNRLTKLMSGKVTYIDTVLDSKTYSVIGKATVKGSEYYLPIMIGARQYLFTYNLRNGRQSLIYILSGMVFENGGIVFYKSLSKVSRLDQDGLRFNSSRTWESKNLDLGSQKNKTIREIFIDSETVSTLSISGDFGTITYQLALGRNHIKCNLPSSFYKFAISASTAKFKISDFKINYVEREK